jgi:hypothetical protein
MPAFNSSCLSWVENDSGTMQLRFRNGRSSTLHGVPEYHDHGQPDAPSAGLSFNACFKGRHQP